MWREIEELNVVDGTPAQALQLRSLVTGAATVSLFLELVDVPVPGPYQVLVRVEAAPINPSDLGLLFAGADLAKASVSGTAERPVVTAPMPPFAVRAAAARIGTSIPAGNEGAGTVVGAGSSPAAQRLLGKTVSVSGGGMYAQYRCADAAACLVLPDGVKASAGASAFINPMTVLGMVATMRLEGHAGIVHTAAASNLGQMLNRVCIEDGVPLVNIVRSAEQVSLLAGQGAKHVLDSTADSFMDGLTRAVQATSTTIAFDAIGGGHMASRILTCMEAALSAGQAFSRYGSATHKQIYIYGGLERGPTELTRGYGMAWGVSGWLLTPFLRKAGPSAVAAMRERVAAGITTTFASSYVGRLSLAAALQPEAIAAYARMATGSKYLVEPHITS